MKHTLIQLSSDYFVVVNDSKIEIGDWIGYPNLKSFTPVKYLGGDLNGSEMKITHSTQPFEQYYGATDGSIPFVFHQVKELSLSEIENLIYGYSVEEMAINLYNSEVRTHKFNANRFDEQSVIDAMVKMFNAHRDFLKDRFILTPEEVSNLIFRARETAKELNGDDCYLYSDSELIEPFFPKTKWEVELDKQDKIKKLKLA